MLNLRKLGLVLLAAPLFAAPPAIAGSVSVQLRSSHPSIRHGHGHAIRTQGVILDGNGFSVQLQVGNQRRRSSHYHHSRYSNFPQHSTRVYQGHSINGYPHQVIIRDRRRSSGVGESIHYNNHHYGQGHTDAYGRRKDVRSNRRHRSYRTRTRTYRSPVPYR